MIVRLGAGSVTLPARHIAEVVQHIDDAFLIVARPMDAQALGKQRHGAREIMLVAGHPREQRQRPCCQPVIAQLTPDRQRFFEILARLRILVLRLGQLAQVA